MKSWGLREDFLAAYEEARRRVLVFACEGELLVLPQHQVREIVLHPKVTRFYRDSCIVGAFPLRGEVYAVVDPFMRRQVPPLVLVLDLPRRYLAVGVERVLGTETTQGKARRRRRKETPWLSEVVRVSAGPAFFLDLDRFLSVLQEKEGGWR